ncbi:MAG: CD1247 N-terminal domain-containing protein [Candidatus Merdivicinus sp.]|jgi:hypothetical protein
MELLEKVAYLKGLMAGMELDPEKKETKLFNAILDTLDDMANAVTDIEAETDEMCDLIDVLDEDLGSVEEYVYGDDEEDDDCDCDCDDCDEECDCEDGELYEVTCPTCGNTLYLDEEMLDEGEMSCPNCGQELEFDLSLDGCDCGTECGGCDCDK